MVATTRETALLTVAAARTGENQSIQYLFHERQRIFTLSPRATADE